MGIETILFTYNTCGMLIFYLLLISLIELMIAHQVLFDVVEVYLAELGVSSPPYFQFLLENTAIHTPNIF
jgi:hypothetical protein